MITKENSYHIQLHWHILIKFRLGPSCSLKLQPSNGCLKGLAVPHDQPAVATNGRELGGTLTCARVQGNLGDDVLVGGV